jgi:hypothetical protein
MKSGLEFMPEIILPSNVGKDKTYKASVDIKTYNHEIKKSGDFEEIKTKLENFLVQKHFELFQRY